MWIWRHGDRSPTAYLRNLSVSKNSWVFGGGGYGELTTIGMNEQFELGKKMKQRYIDHNYLSKYYDSKEVFIRSTDKNRTLISAMSNMLGMFSSTGRTGIDIPDNPNWPKGYMPVPIHAPSEYSDDCLLNSMCKSDLTFELYLDPNSKPVFKIFYLKNPIDNEFEDVTNQIKQCKKVEYCDLQVLLEIANEYQPGENGCENEGRGKTRRHLFSGVGRINGFLWILVVLYGFYMFI
ncbi:unnamed protein product [Caenorhabditis angaria]|uniref:acid phosphatase n=1 Tax=Caenorhabditis angaria TaxID=860376 RepID=A0A9P1IZG6_9PELO|nr:unnamed protein product [Caenorhabditis angaria]